MEANMGQDGVAVDSVENQPTAQGEMKYCKFCGQKIVKEAVLCIHCGRQVEELSSAQIAQPNIVINNNNANANVNTNTVAAHRMKAKNKWVAVLLCIFLGAVGGHKFYEGKIGMGILYLCTMGLFGIGVIVDLICLLLKPNPYYV